jgi:Protein of unknown function (DUF2851)
MNESFLHYIWQHQYFNKEDLKTSDSEPIQIFKPGLYNTNAGPDFSESKIKIGDIEWAGSVEIHIKSSDYLQHKHQHDRAYDNVVLHVVWHNDKNLMRADGTPMPTLELRSRVAEGLVIKYRQLVNSAFQIPCSNSFPQINPLTKISMIEQAAVQRLNAKAGIVRQLLTQNKGDWEETFYQVLAKNFGFKVNADPLFGLAKALPVKTIRKNSGDQLRVEALLFGVAGFLDESMNDEYHQSLKKEFEFLAHKFGLTGEKLHKAQWKFLRLRPANFPTLRIAQLAALFNTSTQLFADVIERGDIASLRKMFSVEPSSYWTAHYAFGKKSVWAHGRLGDESVDNILINSIVPTLAAYAEEKGEERFFDRALHILEQIKPESNAITRAWEELGTKATNAFDSQGLIEQMNSFCKRRNCLNCAVGTALLKPA